MVITELFSGNQSMGPAPAPTSAPGLDPACASGFVAPGVPALRLAKAANAATPRALQDAVTASVRNIVITEHLDMTQSPHERDTWDGLLLFNEPLLRIRKNTRSIVVRAPPHPPQQVIPCFPYCPQPERHVKSTAYIARACACRAGARRRRRPCLDSWSHCRRERVRCW